MIDLSERRSFLIAGFLFEAGLAVIAVIIAWFVGIEPLEQVHLQGSAAAWGVGATVPLFASFLMLFGRAGGALHEIRQILLELLGPPLAACRWYELVGLALLTGFSEELLFRGVLQEWMGRWGVVFGLVGSNVLFGLAHFITPLYALIAGVLGMYLGALYRWPAEGNLVAPMLTHALYDFLAFLVVVQTYRNNHARQTAD
jgi:membrane protease YdiL (CAAX protease family)